MYFISRLSSKKVLRRAFRKIQAYNDKEYGGFLTPAEFIALYSHYARKDKYRDLDLDRALANLRMGISNPQWRYFYCRDGLVKQLNKEISE